MKIASIAEQLGSLGKSSKEKQKTISISEADAIWGTLVDRYDAINLTNTLLNAVKDEDLKMVLREGLDVLNFQVKILEDLMKTYSIPMPTQPPEQANVIIDLNALTDRAIYRTIHNAMNKALHMHTHHFSLAKDSSIREPFRKFLVAEMDLYDAYIEYGKQKGYLHEEPTFRP